MFVYFRLFWGENLTDAEQKYYWEDFLGHIILYLLSIRKYIGISGFLLYNKVLHNSFEALVIKILVYRDEGKRIFTILVFVQQGKPVES